MSKASFSPTHFAKSCLPVSDENNDVHWHNFPATCDSTGWAHSPNSPKTGSSVEQVQWQNCSTVHDPFKKAHLPNLIETSDSHRAAHWSEIGEAKRKEWPNSAETTDSLQPMQWKNCVTANDSLQLMQNQKCIEANESPQHTFIEDFDDNFSLPCSDKYESIKWSCKENGSRCKNRPKHGASRHYDSDLAAWQPRLDFSQSISLPHQEKSESTVETCTTQRSLDALPKPSFHYPGEALAQPTIHCSAEALPRPIIHCVQPTYFQKNSTNDNKQQLINENSESVSHSSLDTDSSGAYSSHSPHISSRKYFQYDKTLVEPTNRQETLLLNQSCNLTLDINSKNKEDDMPELLLNERQAKSASSPSIDDLIVQTDSALVVNTDLSSNPRFACMEDECASCGCEAGIHGLDEELEVNVNNHKIPCMSMKQKLNEDLLRLTEQNFCLCSQNHQLRQSIRNVRKTTMAECSKILDSIINYCECKASSKSGCDKANKRKAASSVNMDRVGAGCSRGLCGGYTPSGWNKLQTIHCLQCDDPECPCCCPPCECPEPSNCCPCPCPCSTGEPPQRKAKAYNKPSCNSQPEDENYSATKSRPSSKILGELAFQLERRILDYVFGKEGAKRRRFYGYTVNNINDMIEKESKNDKGDDDQARRNDLNYRLKCVTSGLKRTGYNIKIHGNFAQQMVNKYGLLSSMPDPETIKEFGLQDPKCISSLITQLARGEHEATNLQVLLKSLKILSRADGGPLFVW